MKLGQKLRQHYVFDVLVNLKGNSRYCVYCEPMWFIPYSLYIPYATLYMYRLGVTDSQIGLVLALGMVMQVVASFVGGVLTDKYGRRRITVIFDIISWSIPCLVWACAQNFWWFVIAAILNSMWQITNNSWTCLLVEDCDKKYIVTIYTCIQICGLVSVFLAPISALLIDQFDLVTVMRGLYLFSFVSMTIKFLILYFKGHETAQGVVRMRETKNVPMRALFGGYKEVWHKLISSPQTLLVLLVMVTYNLGYSTITQSFFSLYASENLLISEKYLVLFPMVRSGLMLAFIFLLQSKVNKLPFRPVMSVGYGLFILSNLLLIVAPVQSVGYLFFYATCEACAMACVVPRKDSLGAIFIDEKERARVSAVLYMLSIGITAPFALLVGELSSINRILPFVLNLAIYGLVLIVVLVSKQITSLDRQNAHH